MPRPGFVLDVDRSTPPMLFWRGEGFSLEKLPADRSRVIYPAEPLPGLDVVIGCGHGVEREKDPQQGENYAPGNRYLARADLEAIDVETGGRYVVSARTSGRSGGKTLRADAERAAAKGHRLLGFYGVGTGKGALAGHLPYATADGDYQPADGLTGSTTYTEADLVENPTLADMTAAALTVLGNNDKGFWLMIEAGDVDWANHDNNLDNAIGAVHSGDAAFQVVVDWVGKHSNWDETLVVLTADHGHYLVLDQPEKLAPAQ